MRPTCYLHLSEFYLKIEAARSCYPSHQPQAFCPRQPTRTRLIRDAPQIRFQWLQVCVDCSADFDSWNPTENWRGLPCHEVCAHSLCAFPTTQSVISSKLTEYARADLQSRSALLALRFSYLFGTWTANIKQVTMAKLQRAVGGVEDSHWFLVRNAFWPHLACEPCPKQCLTAARKGRSSIQEGARVVYRRYLDNLHDVIGSPRRLPNDMSP